MSVESETVRSALGYQSLQCQLCPTALPGPTAGRLHLRLRHPADLDHLDDLDSLHDDDLADLLLPTIDLDLEDEVANVLRQLNAHRPDASDPLDDEDASTEADGSASPTSEPEEPEEPSPAPPADSSDRDDDGAADPSHDQSVDLNTGVLEGQPESRSSPPSPEPAAAEEPSPASPSPASSPAPQPSPVPSPSPSPTVAVVQGTSRAPPSPADTVKPDAVQAKPPSPAILSSSSLSVSPAASPAARLPLSLREPLALPAGQEDEECEEAGGEEDEVADITIHSSEGEEEEPEPDAPAPKRRQLNKAAAKGSLKRAGPGRPRLGRPSKAAAAKAPPAASATCTLCSAELRLPANASKARQTTVRHAAVHLKAAFWECAQCGHQSNSLNRACLDKHLKTAHGLKTAEERAAACRSLKGREMDARLRDLHAQAFPALV